MFLPQGNASEIQPWIFDIYAQGLYLSHTDTVSGYGFMREGKSVGDWELYTVSRIGSDAKSILSRGDAIHDDNYFFLGLGADLLHTLPGLRITLQGGFSWDMVERLHRQDWGYRAGFTHYWDWPLGPLVLSDYAELFYVHRYRNLRAALEGRLFFLLMRYAEWELGPSGALTVSTDSEHLNYNRFVEARGAVSLRYRLGQLYWAIEPQWARVYRSDGDYTEGRLQVSGYWRY